MYYLNNKKKERLEEEMYEKSNEKERKYSKKALLYGTIGIGIVTADYLISSKLGIESLSKSINDMNFHEMIANSCLSISSLAVMGGGAIYGLTYLFENISEDNPKNKIKNFEDILKD